MVAPPSIQSNERAQDPVQAQVHQSAEIDHPFQHGQFPKQLVIALGEYSLLLKGPCDRLHTQLVPFKKDSKSVRDLPHHSFEQELGRFQTSLVRMFAQKLHFYTVFVEEVNSLGKIECFAMSPDQGAHLAFVFKRELEEGEFERIIQLKGRDVASLKQVIPPNFPYIHVEIHDETPSCVLRTVCLVDNTKRFSGQYATSIVKQQLGLSTTQEQSSQSDMVSFLQLYQAFDWTVELQGGEHI